MTVEFPQNNVTKEYSQRRETHTDFPFEHVILINNHFILELSNDWINHWSSY